MNAQTRDAVVYQFWCIRSAFDNCSLQLITSVFKLPVYGVYTLIFLSLQSNIWNSLFNIHGIHSMPMQRPFFIFHEGNNFDLVIKMMSTTNCGFSYFLHACGLRCDGNFAINSLYLTKKFKSK